MILKMDVTNLMESFCRFLSRSWPEAALIFHSEEGIDNWLQCNWETLVETSIESGMNRRVRLEPYGNGADFEGESSRCTFPSALPDHQIVLTKRETSNAVDALMGESVDLTEVEFYEFVTISEDGWFKRQAPFDYVLGRLANVEVVLPLSSVSFICAPRISGRPSRIHAI